MPRKTVTSVLLVICSATGLLGGGAAPAMAMSCQNTDTPASDQALEDFDASVFCLINERRAAHGRGSLRPNGVLHSAAYDYAGSMEAGGFFSHYGDFFGHPAGATPVSRLRQMGYIRPHNIWIVGENLLWTTAEESTPADVIQAWMESPLHRKYLLKAKFRDLGVAAIRGIPSDPSRPTGSPSRPSTDSGMRDPDEEKSRGGEIRSRTLQGVRQPRTEPAWPANTRSYTLASPSPDRTGGQITDRQPGADTDRTPGESASPDPDPYDLTESQSTDRNVRPTELLDRPPKD